MTTLALPTYAQLSDADRGGADRSLPAGNAANTLRAWERDLAYLNLEGGLLAGRWTGPRTKR